MGLFCGMVHINAVRNKKYIRSLPASMSILRKANIMSFDYYRNVNRKVVMSESNTSAKQLIRVLLVEDHKLTRIGLKTVLERTED